MIKITDKEKCCGCSACKCACPKDAINMVYDEEGFLYPKVNEDKCIDCSLCDKACPIITKPDYDEQLKLAFAAKSLDEKALARSTSGGLAYELSKCVIESGGVVFGVCYDEKLKVVHQAVHTLEDLVKLQGSKYVQSDTNDTYKQAKEFLDQGKLVYYTGTPCQIEGLLSYLKKDYDNLITQDLICHGVPSPKLWGKYLDETGYTKADNIIFRDKKEGWESKAQFVVEKDGKEIKRESYYTNMFSYFFAQNHSLRPVCFACPFKTGNKKSDITVADLWGISQILKEGTFDDKGTSMALINSKKGLELFNKIKESIWTQEISYEKGVENNMMMLRSVNKFDGRQQFYSEIFNTTFKKAYKKYRKKDPVILAVKKKLYRLKMNLIGK